MESFAPVPATIGGLLIGLAAAILWLGNGRIAGVSGIFGRILVSVEPVRWRITFLVAMIAAAGLGALVFPGLMADGAAAAPKLIGDPLWLAVAGGLTGLGTSIGNGCTSGHGVCGLGRLSLRSAVAVAVFFLVAMLTVAATGIV
ncbi:MAG: YeeE/YedE family protein [Alphaproteobacteria bacterium]|nr:YeeE/YedE family protein [Alphaproteobacteria bacterium]